MNTNETLPEGTHSIEEHDTAYEYENKPSDYEMQVSWECYVKCTQLFPDADVTYFGYPDYRVLVTPTDCVEGIMVDAIMYVEDSSLSEVVEEYQLMTGEFDAQLELSLHG